MINVLVTRQGRPYVTIATTSAFGNIAEDLLANGSIEIHEVDGDFPLFIGERGSNFWFATNDLAPLAAMLDGPVEDEEDDEFCIVYRLDEEYYTDDDQMGAIDHAHLSARDLRDLLAGKASEHVRLPLGL